MMTEIDAATTEISELHRRSYELTNLLERLRSEKVVDPKAQAEEIEAMHSDLGV